MWQTPLARDLLDRYCGTRAPETPMVVVDWVRSCIQQIHNPAELPKLTLERGATRLTFRLHQQIGDVDADGDWLIVMREVSDTAVIEAMSLSFKLTAKEAEVLYWVVKGKTNKDIGDIFGSSPMTVKKHLERVFIKLGVETRTAAAGMAMGKIKQLQPQFNS
jgi:DNA-binding CsgD family transcriptional regulator